MNNKFDELAKSMAQSVTRRGALKKFGLGLAGMVLAAAGLVNNAKGEASHCKKPGNKCREGYQCCSGVCYWDTGKPQGYCL